MPPTAMYILHTEILTERAIPTTPKEKRLAFYENLLKLEKQQSKCTELSKFPRNSYEIRIIGRQTVQIPYEFLGN